jgi:hypothetical protein
VPQGEINKTKRGRNEMIEGGKDRNGVRKYLSILQNTN